MRSLAIAALLMLAPAVAQDAPTLTVGDVTYEDVQLKKEYPAGLFIQHKDGMVFVEKSKLTEDQIASITNAEEPAAEAEAQAEAEPEPAKPETKTKKAPLEYVPPSPDMGSSQQAETFGGGAQRKTDVGRRGDMVSRGVRRGL